MGTPKFRTVADELLPCALVAYEQLDNLGYRVRCEVADYAAPFTPTLTAVRSSTILHVDIVGAVDIDRVREWVAFGKSAGRDTRIALCLPDTNLVSAQASTVLRDLGVGLYLVSGPSFIETIAPVDLALTLALPPLANLPRKAKELLGPAYERFQRGEWRESFEEACNGFEEESRRYLKHWSKTGRIKVRSKQGPKQLTPTEVNGLSMGQLRDRFRLILMPTLLDSMIAEALAKINPDRVERVHRRRFKRTETRLRANVGRHMWLIVNVLKRMCE